MDTNNTSIDTISVDKKKKSFLPKLLIALSSLFSIVGVGLAILPNHYKSARAVSYDDESYTITLSADELNNYTFLNFNNVLCEYLIANDYDDLSDFFGDMLIHYNDIQCNVVYDETYYNYSIPFIVFALSFNSSSNIEFNFEEDDFTYFLEGGFDSYLVYDFSNFILLYPSIKQAIELDIQANQPYTNNTFLEDIIELLVGGIGVTASGIGSGLSVLVSNIAMQNGAMSPFMSLILIFGGIALALALSRWVVNLISSLGQRNR